MTSSIPNYRFHSKYPICSNTNILLDSPFVGKIWLFLLVSNWYSVPFRSTYMFTRYFQWASQIDLPIFQTLVCNLGKTAAKRAGIGSLKAWEKALVKNGKGLSPSMTLERFFTAGAVSLILFGSTTK